VAETPSSSDLLRALALSGLHAAAPHLYRRRVGGDLQYDGVRPGAGWHAHGYFTRMLWTLVDGEVVRRRLWKRRWLLTGTTRTQHSRPPDDVASVWSCTLVVVLKLWAWLDGAHGLLHRDRREASPSLEEHGSPRTTQRWLARASRLSEQTQHVVRRAVIERSEPRPVEQLFPRGLPPPEALRRRTWRDAPRVVEVWRALALLIFGAEKLETPIPIVLAEARRRLDTTQEQFLI